jgi:hypothetical protein
VVTAFLGEQKRSYGFQSFCSWHPDASDTFTELFAGDTSASRFSLWLSAPTKWLRRQGLCLNWGSACLLCHTNEDWGLYSHITHVSQIREHSLAMHES